MKASERHKLKHDAYADTVVHAVTWARRHLTPILVTVAAVTFVAACLVWFFIGRQRAQAAAYGLLADIEEAASKATFAKPEQQPEAVKKVAGRCDLLAAEHPNSPSAPLALLRAGQLYNRIGRADEAIPYFRRALELGKRRPGLVRLARRGLAAALEESGRLRAAIEQYRLLGQDGTAAGNVQVQWDLGRCYEQLGEPDQAKRCYETVVQRGGTGKWAELARAGLARAGKTAPARSTDAQPSPSPLIGLEVQ